MAKQPPEGDKKPLPNVNITEADLASFHQKHFGGEAAKHFGETFLNPPEGAEAEVYEEEDDGLGYYPDGVKRTLTDEQIAIFRHSEVEQMKRWAEKRDIVPDQKPKDAREGKSEFSAGPKLSTTSGVTKKKKKKKGKQAQPPEPKPDLRKRTWDVVEKGLDSLDYD